MRMNQSVRRGLMTAASLLVFIIGGWFAATFLLGIGGRQAGEARKVEGGEARAASVSEPAESLPKTITSEKDGAEMVLVPSGEFIMGANGGYANEKPEHTVLLKSFYIDKHEVTVAQYKLFLQDPRGKGHEPDESYDDYMPKDYFTNPAYDNHPVVNVSWEDAQAYCRWAGKRLPTEAEWEKAARGTDGRAYPWGPAWDGRNANSDETNPELGEDAFRFTAPVGSFPSGASPFGAHDMAGNVWEWVDGWYQPYEGNNTKDPDYGDTYRVIRGGSWLRYALGLTSSARDTCAPELRYNSIGFRCARDAR